MATTSDLVEYFKLSATYDPLSRTTSQTTRKFNPSIGHRTTTVQEWERTTRLGGGAFGNVWLERSKGDGQLRAVKEVPKGTATSPVKVDYQRELLALSELSKVACPLEQCVPQAEQA